MLTGNASKCASKGKKPAKGYPIAKAPQAAVNELISDGEYANILAKWGISPATTL